MPSHLNHIAAKQQISDLHRAAAHERAALAAKHAKPEKQAGQIRRASALLRRARPKSLARASQ